MTKQFFATSSKKTKGGFPMALSNSSGGGGGGGMFLGHIATPRCVVELSIEGIGSSIRDKPNWWIKIHDPTIVKKWKEEILQASNDNNKSNNNKNNRNGNGFSEESIQNQFQYALDECLWIASIHNNNNNNIDSTTTTNLSSSHPAAAHGVFGCDDLNPSLLNALLSSISILRSRPAIGSTREDRHPGTPQMVDLVHPSLYCYKRGVTNVSKVDGADIYEAPTWENFIGMHRTTESLPTPLPIVASQSQTFTTQTRIDDLTSKSGVHWLPTECRVMKKDNISTTLTTTTTNDEPKKKKMKGEDNEDKEEDLTLECKFSSYINNLHPKQYPRLYESLGRLFCQHAVPLLEDVLKELGTRDKKRERPLRIEDTYPLWDGEPRDRDEDEDEDDYEEYLYDFNENHRTFQHPYVPKFTPPKFEYAKADVSLIDRPLQVIVKIASLELQSSSSSSSGEGGGEGESSSSSSYDGGVWHVEGTLDERIVATACCYVDCENVQGGNLEFRTAVDSPDYEGDDREGIWEMYRMKDGDPLVQPCGTSSVRTGRMLAWPNILQHRVGPVRLIDESKPGRRTIICFFLVDPTLRIRSTATVPPQQKEWFHQELHYLFYKKFPKVVTSHICDFLPSFMSFEDACQCRDELMAERKANSGKDKDGNIGVNYFSLCEH